MHSITQNNNQVCRSWVIYKIIYPHNYLLMTLDGKILRGLFQHERLKLTHMRIHQENVQNLAQLK